jgi:hypothetical protein
VDAVCECAEVRGAVAGRDLRWEIHRQPIDDYCQSKLHWLPLRRPARRSRRNCSSSLLLPQLCNRRGSAGQHDPRLREVPWLRLNLDRVSVLLD